MKTYQTENLNNPNSNKDQATKPLAAGLPQNSFAGLKIKALAVTVALASAGGLAATISQLNGAQAQTLSTHGMVVFGSDYS